MKWNKQRLDIAFNNLKKEGWDLASPLKWGFYFFDESKDHLLDIYNELQEYNYILEELVFIEDLKSWKLYVTKEEILTSQKLHNRNLSFDDLANYFEIEGYDGWDVQRI